MKRMCLMRKTILVTAVAVLVFVPSMYSKYGPSGTAQAGNEKVQGLNLTDTIELMRADMDTQKKTIIADSMGMTGPESEAFWPLYDEYQSASKKLNDRNMAVIKNFLQDLETLSDTQAQELLAEFLSIEKDRLKLKETYVKEFGKKLPPRQVLKYFQLENKLEAAIRWAFAEEIPLIP